MKKLKNRQLFLICTFFTITTFLLCADFLFPNAALSMSTNTTSKPATNTFNISHESGFYEDTILLEFSGESIATVYYTLDGSDPSADNPTALTYDDSISLASNSSDSETIYTIRAIAYYLDGSSSEIYNRTFVIGNTVKARFDVPVLCVTASDNFLWSEERGRFNSENRYKQFSEREVFATLFDAQGNVLFSQSCGHRTHGATSRMKNQISFRLRARSEYDVQNNFEYPLFTRALTNENALISEYKRLIVRNSGNDNGYAFIRNELASQLSIDSGFKEAFCAIPVAVYLNNTYYGFYWLENSVDEKFFSETYGDYNGSIHILGGQTDFVYCNDETDNIATFLVDEYNEKMKFFSTCDLNLDDNWNALNEYIDIENFIHYIAIQHYISNHDSLSNNYKIYRYVDTETESYYPGTIFDGRYRFILFDLDYAFSWNDYSTAEAQLTSSRMTSGNASYIFFANLMSRPECKESYIRHLLSLQNHYFSYEYASNALEEMHASRLKELQHTYTTTDLLINNEHSPDVTCDEDIQIELDKIRAFLINRPENIYQDISNCFGPFTRYDLSVSNDNSAIITMDYATFTGTTFSGVYYEEIPLHITACAKPGYTFKHWIINDDIVTAPAITITEDMVQNGRVEISCISAPSDFDNLFITQIKPNASNDYIVLTNLGTNDIYLNEYTLSDNDILNKSPLPILLLKSGESITIYCKNYTGIDALGQPFANFNIKSGESISLSKKGSGILQTVTVPQLGSESGVYEMNLDTGTFYEFIVSAQ